MNSDIKQKNILYRWLKSTFNRVFIFYPALIVFIELLIRNGNLVVVFWGAPLLLWGYLQFKLSGRYRNRYGGGGPGFDNPPEHLLEAGIYAYTRNPMYLGYLIFLGGLAITFWSFSALILFIYHLVWFQRRVLQDEVHLRDQFGEKYADYMDLVKRWIPGIL